MIVMTAYIIIQSQTGVKANSSFKSIYSTLS
jgi:hypothetical protein